MSPPTKDKKAENTRWSITANKFLSTEQVKILLEYLTQQRDLAIARGNHAQGIRDYYAIRFLLESGLREFEFCALVNADFVGHKVIVKRGKGGKPRTVLVTKATALMVNEWRSVMGKLGLSDDPTAPLFPSRYGRAYSTRGIRQRIKDIFRALKFPENLSGHSLRHTNCSLLMEAKVGLPRIRDNLGHHSISITDLYSHALGNIEDVDIYGSDAANTEKSALETKSNRVSKRNPVQQFVEIGTSKRKNRKAE
ncbi:MAG: tyrosine-type recombinase/integrase [Bdellovibrionales bacterium]|nr:tyrosine-type recombinase/integrase [Bdellovibrionales bacterium]